MKLKHLMTAGLGALVLSCQGPAAVLAQAGAPSAAAAAHPHAAITVAHRVRALEALNRRLAHYVMAERTPAIRARLRGGSAAARRQRMRNMMSNSTSRPTGVSRPSRALLAARTAS